MTDKSHWPTVAALSLAIGLAIGCCVLTWAWRTEVARTDRLIVKGVWAITTEEALPHD